MSFLKRFFNRPSSASSSKKLSKPKSAYNKIDDGIFLGNLIAAKSPQTLQALGIGIVLSVTKRVELTQDEKSPSITYRTILVDDVPEEDILSYFPFSFEVIDYAHKHHMNIYIHCRQGVSRSATVLIAYFMRTRNWTFEKAHEFVLRNRSVRPNHGFMVQLKKYREWRWKVNGNNREYREYLVADWVRKLKKFEANECFEDYFKKLDNAEKPGRHGSGEALRVLPDEMALLCFKCYEVLFMEHHILAIRIKDSMIFIEPQRWMLGQHKDLPHGKYFFCPNCTYAIALFEPKWNWETCQCASCQPPGYHLVLRVDPKVVRVLTTIDNNVANR